MSKVNTVRKRNERIKKIDKIMRNGKKSIRVRGRGLVTISVEDAKRSKHYQGAVNNSRRVVVEAG